MARRPPPSRPADTALDHAKELTARILRFVVSDDGRLARFLQRTGFRLEAIRVAARTSLFMLTVLDAVAEDELLLRDLGQHERITPDMIGMTRARLALQASIEAIQAGPGDREAAAVRYKVRQQLGILRQRSRGGTEASARRAARKP